MKKYKIHIFAILIFILLPAIYFTPMFEGKKLQQSDVMHFQGMAREIIDYRKETGKEALWTNSMFSGMPAYLISMKQPNNFLRYVHKFLTSDSFRPACHVFMYMLGFYILLVLFGINPWIGIVGGIAYGFSSYFFIILVPGHLTKAMALSYMPMIIGAIHYTFRKNYILGGALTSVFLGLQLVANHLQITYYTLLIILVYGIFELYVVVKNKSYLPFLKAIGILVVAVILAIGVNIVNIWTVKDYSRYSLRAPSELSSKSEDRTSGLDKSYATGWSYGVDESLNLMIPDFKGGSSATLIADRDSKVFDYLSKTQGPQNAVNIINQYAYFFTSYWGTQPSTAGPVYIGVVVILLAVFAMFFIRDKLKWWLFAIFILSLLLAWGKNFMVLTDLFLDYFPGYNKFRTVSMILIITQFALPLLAVMGLNKVFFGEYSRKEFLNSLKYSLYIVGGITLIFTLFPTISNLSSPKDEIFLNSGANDIVAALEEDRANILRKDAFRSLIFTLLGGGLIYLTTFKKLKKSYLIAGFGLLILVDLFPVNKRYLNNDNFVPKRQVENAFQPYQADLEILKDKELYYRVFDRTPADPFASSRASYFHHAIGGYHGAKMRRYQELYDAHLSKGSESILDMLNAKYLMDRTEDNRISLNRRTSNLGNGWFVSDVIMAENADEELEVTGNIDPAKEAVVDARFGEILDTGTFGTDSLAYIKLVSYAPNKLVYEFKTQSDQLAVFSDIYYPLGWKAYVNGEEKAYLRTNYVLRGMPIEKGEGSIVFEFHPAAYFTGNIFALLSSLLMIAFLVAGVFAERRDPGREKD